MKKKVVVIMGGISSEREVSLNLVDLYLML